MSFDHIELWTDGSISKNPSGDGGLGVLLISDRLDLALVYGEYVPEDKTNTNNRMELLALIEGLKLIKGKDMILHYFTDSQYVLGGINAGGFSTNEDLWGRYNQILSNNRIVYIKPTFIQGHNGTAKNEFVDKLAGMCRTDRCYVIDRGSVRDMMEKYK